MKTDELISQIYSWLEEADETLRIEALLDLPDMEWVEIRSMSDRGDLVNVTYRGLSLASYLSGEIELVCERNTVRAIRRRQQQNVDDVFGRTGAPAEDETL
jgi:hypothetical protein